MGEALKKCETSIHIKTAIGKLFAKEKNIEKARTWFDNAIRSNPEFGDAWIYYYKLEKQFGDEKRAMEIIRKCIENSPKFGELWISFSKDIANWKLKPNEILIEASELVDFN